MGLFGWRRVFGGSRQTAPFRVSAVGGVLLLFGLLVMGGAWARADGAVAYVEAIEGERVVVLTRPSRNLNLEVYVGRPVEVGDILKTGPATGLRLFYNSGARVLVGRGTEFKVLAETPSIDSLSLAPLPGGELARGQVRAQVDPEGPKPPSSGAPSPRAYRFQVRTRAAVMGVRGTDFVVDAASEKAALHTLTGEVEVGVSASGAGESLRRSVRAGQWVEAEIQKGLTEVRAFDVKAFEARLAAAQPEWSAIEKKAEREGAQVRPPKKDSEDLRRNEEPQSKDRATESDYRGSWTRFAYITGVGSPKAFGVDAPVRGLEWRPSFRVFWDRVFLSPRVGAAWVILQRDLFTGDSFLQLQMTLAAEVRVLWGLTGNLFYGQERWSFGGLPLKTHPVAGWELGWQFASRSPFLGVRRLAMRGSGSTHVLQRPGNTARASEATTFIGGSITFEF